MNVLKLGAGGRTLLALVLAVPTLVMANADVEKNIANSKNWAMQAGDMYNQRYSKLNQINTGNVGKMQVAWTFSTGVLRGHEGSPLVIGDTMYLHSPFPNKVFAIDLNTQKILWKYEPKQDPAVIPQMCCDTVNRGLAYAENKVFLQQADSTLVASGATGSALDLAKARLELDQEQVDDAKEDLVRAGGDLQGRLQAMVQEHRETSHSSDSVQVKVTAKPEEGGLVQTARQFSQLRKKDIQLQQAMVSAESASVKLATMHDRLDEDSTSKAGAASNISRRSGNQKRLARVYANWSDEVRWQERGLANRALRSIVGILVLGLVLLFSDAMVVRVLERFDLKRRSAQRWRVVIRVALQALSVLLILVILFGTPNNLGTIIGLAGAGLTVALKDFIVSFVGWIVLMGKHGIRIGDLVEINSVTGEVVELGMFNTVLHETGNWTDGHATGRRVTFTNSYAVEGHYFNFSTSGQWMWDEVRIDVPSGTDPYPVVEALQKHVEETTEETAKLAEQEWNRALRSPGVSTITAAPAITIKPVMEGVEITLRYITHAAERYDVRSKLYRAAVEVLAKAHSLPTA